MIGAPIKQGMLVCIVCGHRATAETPDGVAKHLNGHETPQGCKCREAIVDSEKATAYNLAKVRQSFYERLNREIMAFDGMIVQAFNNDLIPYPEYPKLRDKLVEMQDILKTLNK